MNPGRHGTSDPVPAHGPSTIVNGSGAQFPSTLWSIVLAAGRSPSEKSQEALSRLCRSYWYPIYAFLRRQGKSPHDAEDLTQGFFAALLDRQGLGHVARERGKFRTFLLACLHNYVCDQYDKASAQKRGGGLEHFSLNALDAERRYLSEPSERFDPEQIYERRWAMTLLDRVINRLEAEHDATGKAGRFERLSIFLTGDGKTDSYAAAARDLGLTESAVKMSVLRLRQRYRELFRLEIAETVESDDEIDNEMRHVFNVLAG